MTTASETQARAKVLAISSGKGGVGKSNISTNLAVALARCGHRVCVFDADTSLANINVLLGLQPRLTLEHLLTGQANIDDIVLSAPGDIDIVPSASGIAAFTRLDPDQQQRLLAALKTLEARYDYLLIDTAAGIGSSVTLFLHAVEHCLLVVTPEPTSLTDAFALMKVLRKQNCRTTVHVLTNMVDSYRSSIDVYRRLSAACQRYLETQPVYFGYVPRDEALRRAVQLQQPVLLAYPGAPVSARFLSLARSMNELLNSNRRPGGFSLFWQKLLLRQTAGSRATPAITGKAAAQAESSASPRFNKAIIISMQSGMAQLIRSRTLPRAAMLRLIGSLLRQIRKHYPGITDEDLLKAGREVPLESVTNDH